MNGLSAAISNTYDGVGLGAELGGGGDGSGVGVGTGDGLGNPDGLGEADREADGDGVGDGQLLPLRKISCVFWPPHPLTIPFGWAYQSRILLGSALTKRLMIVWPTLSPKARIVPPPPLGAVLPTQTPATMSGL